MVPTRNILLSVYLIYKWNLILVTFDNTLKRDKVAFYLISFTNYFQSKYFR